MRASRCVLSSHLTMRPGDLVEFVRKYDKAPLKVKNVLKARFYQDKKVFMAKTRKSAISASKHTAIVLAVAFVANRLFNLPELINDLGQAYFIGSVLINVGYIGDAAVMAPEEYEEIEYELFHKTADTSVQISAVQRKD